VDQIGQTRTTTTKAEFEALQGLVVSELGDSEGVVVTLPMSVEGSAENLDEALSNTLLRRARIEKTERVRNLFH